MTRGQEKPLALQGRSSELMINERGRASDAGSALLGTGKGRGCTVGLMALESWVPEQATCSMNILHQFLVEARTTFTSCTHATGRPAAEILNSSMLRFFQHQLSLCAHMTKQHLTCSITNCSFSYNSMEQLYTLVKTACTQSLGRKLLGNLRIKQ